LIHSQQDSGHPDETVSSVIGKNIVCNDPRGYWVMIDSVLAEFLEESGNVHGPKHIEEDEGDRK
jgi:hypothetical protein